MAIATGPTPSSAPVVSVDGEQLTVDATEANLGELLQAIGTAAGFEVRTTGELGRVSAHFSVASLEEGLRRLVQDHELMLVYRPAEGHTAAARLAEVRVFGPAAAAAAPAAERPPDPAPGAGTLAEIRTLSRSTEDPAALSRLAEILTSSPDAVIRARAAWALSRAENPAAATTLMSALRDPAPEVRLQAAYAVGRMNGPGAIPELSRLLLSDPDLKVRRAVIRTLGGMPDPAATAALRSAAADSDPTVRQEVTRALERQAGQQQ